MNACAKSLVMVLLLSFGCSSAMAAKHRVPKDRLTLTDRDWLPFVVSKIAPLEWWGFASASAEISQEDYASEHFYAAQKQDSWHFPRFCFSFFRPKLEAFSSLLQAVNEYQGDVVWSMSGYCITAVPGLATSSYAPMTAMPDRQKLEEFLRNPPQADPEFVKRAMRDIPTFAAYIEQRLGLKDKPAVDFDPQWLTQKGLAESRAPFEDYLEPGDWSVFLALKPQEYARVSKQTSPADRALSMGIGMYQNDILLQELGAVWQSAEPDEPSNPVVPGYPLLSRLSDIASDTIYEPDEIDALLAEYLRAQAVVKDSQSIRGLDNLIRIARRAQKLKLGIYFGGQ